MRALLSGFTPGRLRTDVAWSVLARVSTVALGAVSTVILARRLGPDGAGVFSLGLLLPGVLLLVINLGLAAANTFNTGAGRIAVQRIVGTSVWFTLVGSALAAVVVLALQATGALRSALAGLPRGALIAGMVSLPILLLRDPLAAVLLGAQRIRIVSVQGVVQSVTWIVVLAIVVGILGRGATWALAAYDVGAFAALAVVVVALRRMHLSLTPRFDRAVVRASLGFGMAVTVGQALQFLNYRLDVFFVNAYSGVKAVGIYSVSARLAELLWIIPAAVGMVIFPKAAATEQASMNRLSPRVFWSAVVFGGACALVLGLAGPIVIRVLFSSAFSDAYTPMVILLPGAVILGASGILANDLAGRGAPLGSTVAALGGVVATVLLDVLLIPRFGIAGAAWASTVAYTTYAAIVVISYLRITGAPLREFVSALGSWRRLVAS